MIVIGQIYNNIEVIGDTGKRTKDRNIVVSAKCYCGKVFDTDLSSLRRNRVKSCGCSRIKNLIGLRFNRIIVIDITNNRDKYNNSVVWMCQCDCGKLFQLSTAQLKHPDRVSCGCYKDNIIAACKRRGGPNHHKYNHLLTDSDRVRRRGRQSTETYEFKKHVFCRDNYTCQVCSKRGGDLNAHHLNGYHWYKVGRNDINNGVTLCCNCHNGFHAKYGYTYNTISQYKEYLNEQSFLR